MRRSEKKASLVPRALQVLQDQEGLPALAEFLAMWVNLGNREIAGRRDPMAILAKTVLLEKTALADQRVFVIIALFHVLPLVIDFPLWIFDVFPSVIKPPWCTSAEARPSFYSSQCCTN